MFVNFLIFISTVSWKPVFRIQPQNVSVHKGENVVFLCEATGFPWPDITWLKNNSPITNATVIHNGSLSFLLLRSVTKEESRDKYQCFASNSVGATFSKEAAFVIISATDVSGQIWVGDVRSF